MLSLYKKKNKFIFRDFEKNKKTFYFLFRLSLNKINSLLLLLILFSFRLITRSFPSLLLKDLSNLIHQWWFLYIFQFILSFFVNFLLFLFTRLKFILLLFNIDFIFSSNKQKFLIIMRCCVHCEALLNNFRLTRFLEFLFFLNYWNI